MYKLYNKYQNTDVSECQENKLHHSELLFLIAARGETRALIGGGGGGGEYSYNRVLPNEFLLKSIVFKFISKEISQAEHEYMNIHPPPPQN